MENLNMNKTIEIRQATKEDVAKIESILCDVVSWMKHHNWSNLWTKESVQWERLSIEYQINDFFLAFDHDDAVACMVLTDNDPTCWPQNEKGTAIYLHKLAVKRAYAGRNISGQMIQFAKEYAIQKNIKKVCLDCNQSRTKLCAVYEKNGFEQVGCIQKREDYFMALYQLSIK